MQTIIDSMYLKEYKANVHIITQGEIGDKYFILKSGKCEVIFSKKPPVFNKQGMEGRKRK